jgi:triacylglycerol lipase
VPVIFVHGYASDSSVWEPAAAHLAANGWSDDQLVMFDYPTTGEDAIGVVETSERLAETVAEVRRSTGAPKVDIVTHSLGSLVTQHCIVYGGCADAVARWANVAGAQNGTQAAYACEDAPCFDMRPGSEVLIAVQAQDDTVVPAQGVTVRVYWTPDDGIIIPVEASFEPYAKLVEVAIESDELHHVVMLADDGMITDIKRFFAR